jgi:methionyl-tRNA formyltransferase
MTDARPRIVFMGTPEFAVATLNAIVKSGADILAVVTVPDKPSGRGQKISISPVKEYALKNNIEILQPAKLKDEDFIERLRNLKADIFVVVAFRMLPEQVWSIPPHGTFNAHASLLPQYRGAAPINHAIINGETKTGVTTFLIDNEIDTGKILLSEELSIGPDETAGELHDRLMLLSADLVVKTIRGLLANSLVPKVQKSDSFPSAKLNPAPKIFPSDTIIDWRKGAREVHNFIRGLSPYPGARTTLIRNTEKLTIKIYGSRIADQPVKEAEIYITDDGTMLTGCSDGAIEITHLQAEGRKKMTASEFLRGFDISKWHIAI